MGRVKKFSFKLLNITYKKIENESKIVMPFLKSKFWKKQSLFFNLRYLPEDILSPFKIIENYSKVKITNWNKLMQYLIQVEYRKQEVIKKKAKSLVKLCLSSKI